ncbi:uncharacterized protein [Aquarana catesbeiana]|uniref:uncharacterized protein isoform X4 n=1 Tax=Aquarana catesbeiana TaxID=8400 RepID=UPI003CC9AFE0
MLKPQRRIARQTGLRCAKEEFVCQGWDISIPYDYEDEDLMIGSFTQKCKYLNRDCLVISPTLYLRASESKRKKEPSCLPYPVMSDISSESKSIKQPEDKLKIFSSLSGPSVIKYSTANKDAITGNEKGSRVRRLICITDSIPSRHTLDQTTSTDEKNNVSADQRPRSKSVITTQQGSNPCILQYKKDTMIENYKDAIAKLRGQTAWKSFSSPSENLVKSSFHGHIQTCILQLSNRSPVQPMKLITCSDNSSFLKSSSEKINVFEGRSQRIQAGHHHGSFPASPVLSVNKNIRLDAEKFVWCQNTQDISRTGACDDKTGLVNISPLSSGKENAIDTQRVQSALKHNNSAQNQSRHISDQNKDLGSLGSQVTLGLMLNAIRTGLKQNQIRVMLGQDNSFLKETTHGTMGVYCRFTEANAKEEMNKNQHNFSLIHIRQESK